MPNTKVTALYRHPVKSMTPEQMQSLQLTSDGRVQGDRVLGLRFENAGDPSDWTWQTKHNFVGLVNAPGLATMQVKYTEATRTLRIHAGDLLIAEGSVADEAARAQLAGQLADYVLTMDINPLEGHPERQPPVLVGDGVQPLFHDTATGLVTLYSAESLAALAEKLGDDKLDGRRFRANVVISGVDEPFEELSWIGRNVHIGETEFTVTKPVVRCLVTHANPETGKRDHDIMNTLVRHFTPESPLFSVVLEAVSGTRQISLNDPVELV